MWKIFKLFFFVFKEFLLIFFCWKEKYFWNKFLFWDSSKTLKNERKILISWLCQMKIRIFCLTKRILEATPFCFFLVSFFFESLNLIGFFCFFGVFFGFLVNYFFLLIIQRCTTKLIFVFKMFFLLLWNFLFWGQNCQWLPVLCKFCLFTEVFVVLVRKLKSKTKKSIDCIVLPGLFFSVSGSSIIHFVVHSHFPIINFIFVGFGLVRRFFPLYKSIR